METVPLTADEADWLQAVTRRQGHSSLSSVLQKLLNWVNGETPAAKKKIFLVIRCRRCSAGARGGVKTDHQVELPVKQWEWLENVKERCGHASVAKTVRIIVDFYMPLCQADLAMEEKMLRAGREPKIERHADAVGNVDPTRAPRRGQRCGGKFEPAPRLAHAHAGQPPGASPQSCSPISLASDETADTTGRASTADASHESDSDATQGGSAESSAADTWEEEKSAGEPAR